MNARRFEIWSWVAGLLAVALESTPVSGQTTTPPVVTNAPDSGDCSIVQRGPNSRLWQRTLLYTNADGTVTTNTQGYTDLSTGLCYISNASSGSNSQWLDAVEEVDTNSNIIPAFFDQASSAVHISN